MFGSDPAFSIEAVVPHASTNFPGGEARAIYVGVAGDVAVVSPSDQVVVFKAVPAGTILPVRCKRINAVNTAATDMVALR